MRISESHRSEMAAMANIEAKRRLKLELQNFWWTSFKVTFTNRREAENNPEVSICWLNALLWGWSAQSTCWISCQNPPPECRREYRGCRALSVKCLLLSCTPPPGKGRFVILWNSRQEWELDLWGRIWTAWFNLEAISKIRLVGSALVFLEIRIWVWRLLMTNSD